MEKHLQPKFISNLVSGVSVNSDNKEIINDEKGILKTSSVVNGKFIPTENKRILVQDLERARLNPIKDSLLISRMNTPDLVGNFGFIDKDYPNLFIPDRLWMTVLNDNIIPKFLNYCLLTPKSKFKITSLATGTSNSMKNISKTSFLDIEIATPPLPEQQKIADYLTIIDKKIELLEEKKTELSRYKKAMMQKLFAQEICFKDENGNDYPEWEEKRLGDVFNSFNGLTGKTKENFGFGKPYIKYTQVFGSSKIDVGGFDLVEITANDKQNQAQYGDAFFTVSSETPHEVGMSSVLLDEVDEVYLNSFCFGIRPKSQNLNPHYYRYFFRSKNFRKEVVKLAQGSTRYNMSKVEFMKINIEIPSLSEQQKIADFLSAIDESITKVEEQIKETQNFKKAMLQQMFV